MTLSRDRVSEGWTGTVDLEYARVHRERAVQNGSGLVSVEYIATARGALTLEVITNGVDMLYTGDRDIVRIGASMNVPVTALWDMDPPPSTTQLFDETE